MFLSIIIPVYDVEKYIGSCLRSVINQQGGVNDIFEVIIVNDGTPDRSMEIINTFDWIGQRHKIINQDNQGLSVARNTGLDNASGDYIWFVDSDDMIANDAICKLKELIVDQDLIYMGHTNVRDDTKTYCPPPINEDIFKPFSFGISSPAQFVIYKRSFLLNNKLRFKKGIYHEDTEFTPRCIFLAQKIGCISDSLYYYQIRSGSIMTSVKPKRAFDCLIVANSLISFSIERGLSVKETPMNRIICITINNALDIISKSDIDRQKEWINWFLECEEYSKTLASSSILKYRIEGILFKLFPRSIISVYKILRLLK